MSNLKDALSRILNPRSRLEKVPSFANSLVDGEAPGGAIGGLSWRDIFGNIPLMSGILLVIGLLALVLYGPVWAPQNPYIAGQHIVPHFDRERNEFIRPPLDPSPEYPLGTDQWGADILSLLMHGARNTLVASAFITMVRVLLGLTLGAIAGWNEGQAVDRFIMGTVGMIASLPLLISAIILIYALDIRRGLLVFIIALSIIGWTEIAQYIRSEFLVLRKMPYIEGARATGLNGLQIAVRHVLPNVLPQLLVITFLEMGAVLMLLGELGFVGVYIGGGSRIDLTEPLGPENIITLADVPEWGAMIADGFRWLRSKPFIVFPPAVAFFVSVLGFNLLGEGLRRLIEKRMVSTAFLLRKRMLAVIAGMTLAVIFIMNNTGAAPWFAKVAQAFNGSEVVVHVAALAAMDGRGQGQPGGAEAAAYIAAKFEEYGLEQGWRQSNYIYPVATRLVRPLTQPALTLLDAANTPSQTFRHQLDFGYMIEGHGGSGDVTAPVTLVGFQPGRDYDWESYAGLDLRGKIVLLVRGNAPPDFPTEALIRGAVGVLWVTGDGRDDVRSQIQLADPAGEYLSSPTLPVFRLRPSTAQTLLQSQNNTLTDLFAENLPGTESWFTHDLDVSVHMSLQLSQPEATEIPNVLGYIPGSDLELGNQIVILFARYDGLGIDPDGTVYPGANHNASGMAVLLELARLWQEQGLDSRRTTMFVAWGGAQLDDNSARDWLEDDFNFRHVRTQGTRSNVGPSIIIQLDYVGAGGDTLLIHPNSSARLADLLEETSLETELAVLRQADTAEFSSDIVTRRLPLWLSLKWADSNVSPEADVIENIDPDKLQLFGETLALTLTRLARETSY